MKNKSDSKRGNVCAPYRHTRLVLMDSAQKELFSNLSFPLEYYQSESHLIQFSTAKKRILVRYGSLTRNKILPMVHCLFPKRQILDSSKLKEFADDSFKFDENGRKFSKRIEKHSL